MNDQQTPPRLAIFACIGEAYDFMWSNRADFFRMSALPVLILAFVHTVAFTVFPQTTDLPSVKAIATRETAAMFLYAMFGVAWHRRFLRHSEQTTFWEALRWDGRKTLFFLRFILAVVCATLAALPPILILMIGGGGMTLVSSAAGTVGMAPGHLLTFLIVIAFAVWLIVFTRMSIWLPATAIDERYSFVGAWGLGRNNSWTLVGITLGAMLPLMLIISVALSFVVSILVGLGIQTNLTGLFLAGLALGFAKYLALAAEITALSVAYQKLSRPTDPGMPIFRTD
ncbi:MAG TPA: hypothetical protein DCS82_13185 [Rhodospirillaceae bacterium]|nr:hypothetical protein [Rhodospirillaceae bacterium]HAA91875.1 hypothetical protein [Rhodospirillaceae bacterium]HAT36661.1 hypothetical protein [Rhodospirillaceae bacterium]|tara:strand:+ start:392 stop:1243 length:852 start_codon:yes stop_codon:yes gene_type:complete